MKKSVSIILILFVLSILLTNFISASFYEGMSEVFSNIRLIAEPIVSFLLGGDLTGGALFTKLLIFIIILSLVWIGTQKSNLLNEYPKTQKILVGIISILAIQGISYGFVDVITLPYTGLGIALSAGLPFVIYFLILHVGFAQELPSVGRRIAWIFFAVIFLGLVASNIGGVINLFIPTSWGLYWIYLATSAIALICAFMDGTIRNIFAKIESDRLENIDKLQLLTKYGKRKEEYKTALDNHVITDKEFDRLMKRLRLDAKRWGIKRRI